MAITQETHHCPARLYVQAAIALHNFLRTTESTVYCPPGFIDAEDSSGNPLMECGNKMIATQELMQRIGQAGSKVKTKGQHGHRRNLLCL